MRKYVLGSFVVLLAGVAFAVVHGSRTGRAAAESKPRAAQAVKPSPAIEIRDWFALGSGCRAVPKHPPNVRYELVQDRTAPNRHRAIIHFDDYGLFGDRPIVAGGASFARECGIRFGVYPPSGFKLSNASAQFEYSAERQPGADVRMRGRLFIGKVELSQAEVWLRDGDPRAARRRFDLAPSPDKKVFPNLRCEEPKIVGLDLSAATVRKAPEQAVSVRLVDNRAEVTFETVPCASSGAK